MYRVKLINDESHLLHIYYTASHSVKSNPRLNLVLAFLVTFARIILK